MDANIMGTPEVPEKPEKKKQPAIQSVYDIVETFCVAIIVMLLLFMFVCRYVTVVGTSMTDTLQSEDKLIISNFLYTPKTGDIIVIRTDTHPLIKRVIATGGQHVRINFNTWQVWVSDDEIFEDSEILDERAYVKYEYAGKDTLAEMKKGSFVTAHEYYDERTNVCEFVVPEHTVFAMGDNRNGSTDSRHKGCFGTHEIIGHVIFRLAPHTGGVK